LQRGAGDGTALLKGNLRANPAIGADFTDPDNCSAPDPRLGRLLERAIGHEGRNERAPAYTVAPTWMESRA
jgi:hypothetical protein